MRVLVVVFHPDLAVLRMTLQACAQAHAGGVALEVELWHNDSGPDATPGLGGVCRELLDAGLPLTVQGGRGNLGFGRAINAAVDARTPPFLLLLNQDAVPEPESLGGLLAEAVADDANVAAWEMRQIPYEHPKDYDPVTGDTGWCSGAILLLRTGALRAVAGFEPRFFMYCEDVDLSWRLRCGGWRMRYRPRWAAVHRTYRRAAEVKPLAYFEGRYANLCLRTRYGSVRDIFGGLWQLLAELGGPDAFEQQKQGLRRALRRYARDAWYFWRTRRRDHGFRPCLRGWDYEQRREGVFHEFRSSAERPLPLPAVTAFVRACGDDRWLREWLDCVSVQTHPPRAIFIVHDPAITIAPSSLEWRNHVGSRPPIGTVAAPSTTALEYVAASMSTESWLLFDRGDTHLLYADHIEVLLQAAIDSAAPGAHALVWSIHVPRERRQQGHAEHADRHVLDLPHGASLSYLARREGSGGIPSRVARVTAAAYLPANRPAVNFRETASR